MDIHTSAKLTRSGAQRWLVRLFALLMRLYPRSFRHAFADEMTVVFADALTDVAPGGMLPQLRLISRELSELPVALLVEHYHEWRPNMHSLTLDTHHEINIARWTARLLSLLLATFVTSVALFNEDVRTDPTLPMLIILLLTIGLLLGWRWERAAAWIALTGSPLLLVTLLAHNLSAPGLVTPVWTLVLVAAAMAGAFALVGWLYASVARYQALAATGSGQMPVAGHKQRSRRGAILLLGGAAIVALLLFTVPWGVPVRTNVTFPSTGSMIVDSLMADLRLNGAVVGIASIPAQHPEISVAGTILVIDNEEVYLFEYPDVIAATSDARPIFNGQRTLQGDDLIQAGNILLVFEGVTPHTRSLLAEAIARR